MKRICEVERRPESTVKATANSVSRAKTWVIFDKPLPGQNGSIDRIEVTAVVNGDGEGRVHFSDIYVRKDAIGELIDVLAEAHAWLSCAQPPPKEFE